MSALPSPRPLARIALVGGQVVPVTGPPIDQGVVLFADGLIEAVGDASLPIPSDAYRIDVTGCHVVPGLIDPHTHLGVLPDGDGWADADVSEDYEAIGPRLRAVDAVNSADMAFRDAVAGGVLAVGINPGSCCPIGGQAVAMRTHGHGMNDMLLRAPCGMKSGIGENPKRDFGLKGRAPITRMGTAAMIRRAVEDARRHLAAGDGTVDLDADALGRVLSGEIPWRQHVHRADDIVTAVRLADEFGYRLVIEHGTEADRVAGLLAERDIPVITGPLVVARFKDEMKNRSLGLPGRLAAAGVAVAICTDHGVVPVHCLAYQAALAVREGLDPTTALAAITIVPARILGVAEQLGSLEPGKDADLCVWSGDPLDARQRVLTAFVRGHRVYSYDTERGVGVLDGEDWTL